MIGIFDSGIGGLSVYKEILSRLPGVSTVYLGDQAYAPYGTKTKLEIGKRGQIITNYLLSQGAQTIVIACNTATVNATVNDLRQSFPQTVFIGVEPPVKPLSLLTKTNRVAIYATPLTCQSERLRDLISTYAKGKQVFVTPTPEWVQLVEGADLASANARQILRQYTDDHLKLGIDYAGLGCTHFSFLKQTLKEVTNGQINFIDIGQSVAKRVESLLPKTSHTNSLQSTHRFFTTSPNTRSLSAALKNLLKISTKVEWVNI